MSTSAALPVLTGLLDANLLIGDVARLSGLSIDTLRYYDRAGLLGAVHRDSGGRRVFDRNSLGLLDVVLRLRRTGMPVEDVRHFVDLVRSGDTQRAGRLDLLRAHRRRVLAQLDQLQDDLAVIDWKIAVYQAGEDGTEPPPPPPGWPRPQGHLPEPDTMAIDHQLIRSTYEHNDYRNSFAGGGRATVVGHRGRRVGPRRSVHIRRPRRWVG